MLSKDIKIFDATLRDGSHALKHQLELTTIEEYCKGIDNSGVEAVIVGHGNGLGASSIQIGMSKYPEVDMLKTARKNLSNTKLGVYMIPGFGTIRDNLIPALDIGVDVFKIGTHCTEADVMKERMLDIYPDAEITVRKCFFLPENAVEFPFDEYDYIVDAIDTVSAKIELILRAKEAGVPIISSMGTGNKLDPSRLRIADLSETRYCHLARVMRKELRRRGVEHVKVIYSEEVPDIREEGSETKGSQGRPAPGSTAFVPPVAGLMIAGEVVRHLAGV